MSEVKLSDRLKAGIIQGPVSGWGQEERKSLGDKQKIQKEIKVKFKANGQKQR